MPAAKKPKTPPATDFPPKPGTQHRNGDWM